SGRERVVLACAGIALAIHFASWIASLEYTSVAISTLLVGTTPIWTAAYDAVVYRHAPPRAALAAFVAGAIGLAMIVSYDRTPAPHPGAEMLGDSLALVGAAAIGAYLLLVRTVRARLGTRSIVTQTYSWAAAALVFAALCARQSPPPLSATAAWGGILAMALVSQLLGHTAINASLRWFSPSAVAFATLLEPVFAAALALAIFGEAIPPLGLAGGLIVLGAIAVVLWTDPKRELA
ncbi:MAG TPA: DMT family transporter, partial [Candidatus Baltobacteraceae bacterium]|nr:DMT family transporter [Candidatus Baltobacteraceae bacterium]